MSTKIDLSSVATTATYSVDLNTTKRPPVVSAECDDPCPGAAGSTCKSVTSSSSPSRQQQQPRGRRRRRCLGNESTSLAVLCAVTCAVAVYCVNNNRLLSQRLSDLEYRCVELTDSLSLQQLQQQQQLQQEEEVHEGLSSSSEHRQEPSPAAAAGSGRAVASKPSAAAAAAPEAQQPRRRRPDPEVAVSSGNKPEVVDTIAADTGVEPSGRGLIEGEGAELGSGDNFDIDLDPSAASAAPYDLESSGEEPSLVYDLLGEKSKGAFLLDELLWEAVHQASSEFKVRSPRSADQPEPATTSDDELSLGDDPAAGQRSRPAQPARRQGTSPSAAAAAAAGRQQDKASARPRNPTHRNNPQMVNSAAASLSVKVAQFIAPRRDGHYVSDDTPPVVYRFWQVDNATTSPSPYSTAGQAFFIHNPHTGIVTILEPGIYQLYAQMVYHDLSGRWAFGVYVNDVAKFKCINTEQLQHHPHLLPVGGQRRETDSGESTSGGSQTGSRNSNSHSVYQTCFTSGLLRLEMYSQLSLRCLYGGKAVVMQPGFTYWGLVKLVSL